MRSLYFLFFLLFSWPALAGAFNDYRAVQVGLYSAQVTQDTVQRARRIFPDQPEFLALVQEAAEAPKAYFINARQAAQKAYVAFVRLPASADVLHDFIAEKTSYFASRTNRKYPGSDLAWLWAYLEKASVIGYEATGEQRFIDQALRVSRYVYARTDTALGIRDGMGRDNLRGWSLDFPGKGTAREPTLAGRIVAPMLQLAIAVKGKTGVPDDIRLEIEKNASEGVAILKTYLPYQIVDGNERYFNDVFSGEPDAFNHVAAYALAAAYAYRLTGDTTFRDFAVGFRSFFLAHIRKGTPPSAAYSWDYQFTKDPKKRHSTLLWKASITTSALADMQDAGIGLKHEDQVGLALAFVEQIVGENYTVYARVGSGSDNFPLTGYNLFRSDQTNIQTFTLFTALDRWVPNVRDIVLSTVAFRPDLFSEGLLAGPLSSVGYARLLENHHLGK